MEKCQTDTYSDFHYGVEYSTCYEATCQVTWLRKLISEMLIVKSISRPLAIYYDNSFVVCFSQNHKNSSRMKHFDVKLMFVREKTAESRTYIKHIPGDKMFTDVMTKGLPIGVFQNHITHIDLVKSFGNISA